MIKNPRLIIWIIAIVIVAAAIYFTAQKTPSVPVAPPAGQTSEPAPTTTLSRSAPPAPQATATPVTVPAAGLAMPISNALSRITKKPFGIYVTPQNSPVQPEKFIGYHTGVDFETTPAEQNIDVPVYAICSGTIKLARYASGYGGVMVEACTINDQADTVIYGHLRQSSFIPKVGQIVTAGDKLAVLGTGYSSETDGERKHLHLGIHKGTAINILGYVQNKADLSGWIDPLTVLQ